MSAPRAVVLERTLYAAAALPLGLAANLPAHNPIHIAADVAGAAGGASAIALYLNRRHADAGRWCVRLSPLMLTAAVDIAARYSHHWGWNSLGWDLLMAAGWAAYGWGVLPLSKTTRHRFRPPAGRTPLPGPKPTPALLPAPLVPAEDELELGPGDSPDDYSAGVRLLWKRAGNPGRTKVVKADPHPGRRDDLTMILRASEHGRPITGITHAMVAAAFGVTEVDVVLAPVGKQAGRQGGPGWLEVHVIPEEIQRRRKNPTDEEWWHDHIAADAIPGSRFVGKHRDPERKVTFWTARKPDAMGEPRVNMPTLCRALGVSYDDGRVFITLDGQDILVSVWDTSPLAKIYEATRELLTPDSEGRWVAGYLTNGQPARQRVYTDRGAAMGLYVAPSGGGKTQLMACSICAAANFGAVVWLVTEAPDEKTAALAAHVDRYGVGALFMLRAMRAVIALMEIRGTMLWADGRVHDWDPKLPGCPYRPLSVYWDEFLSAARSGLYGAEVMDLAERISVKGRKYGIGENVAGQSVYVQDGFTQLLNENLRENCIPIVLKVAPKKVPEMFKTLGVAQDDIPDPLPRSFSKAQAGRIERIMNGQPEPPSDSNTGGVGWIIEGRRPEVLRTLLINFSRPIRHLFPDTVQELTRHEITELEARGLWFDWSEPPRPGEFGDVPEEDEADLDDFGNAPPWTNRGPSRSGVGSPTLAGQSHVSTTRQALEAIKKLRV